MVAPLIIAGAISAAGALASANQNRQAAEAAQFQGFNVAGPGGTTTFDGQQITNTLGNQEAQLRGNFLSGASASLDQNAVLAEQLRTQGGAQIADLGAQAINTSNLTPAAAAAAGAQFGQQGMFAQQAGQQGVQNLFGAPSAAAATAASQQAGQAFLGRQGESFNALAGERLSALREQARPQEERFANQRIQNLFSSGALGTTGGARAIEGLAQGEAQADLSRITSAQDFAQQQQNISAQQALQGNQIGAQLTGQGFQGLGLDQVLAAQQGGLGVNLLGQAGQATGNAFEVARSADATDLSRGQTRLATAENLFGFGQNIQQADLQRGLTQIGGAQSFDANLLQQSQLGASVGQAQSAAAANAATLGAGQSPFGAALQGVGTGLANNPNFSFGGGGSAAQTEAQQRGLTNFSLAGGLT